MMAVVFSFVERGEDIGVVSFEGLSVRRGLGVGEVFGVGVFRGRRRRRGVVRGGEGGGSGRVLPAVAVLLVIRVGGVEG